MSAQAGLEKLFGGLHKKYKIIPDICILGKILGNGYPYNCHSRKKRYNE